MPVIPSDMVAFRAHMEKRAREKPEEPDWDALKARQTAAWNEFMDRLAEKLGWDFSKKNVTIHVSSLSNAICYCNCGLEGDGKRLCQHKWNGKLVEIGDHGQSSTCSRCGMSSFHHDIRVLP